MGDESDPAQRHAPDGRVVRAQVPRDVLGLHRRDEAAVVREYTQAGYRACWHGGEPHGAAVIHRLATFHLDRIDLSRVDVGERRGGTIGVLRLFKSTTMSTA